MKKPITIGLIAVIVIVLILGSIPQSSFAQTYTGVLTLDPIPSVVKTGQEIVFSGILKTTDGLTVRDALIYIKDDVDFDIDTVLGTITTDNSGRFSATWEAFPRSSGAYDFYAVYEGGGSISKARSVTYSVTVSSSSSVPSYSDPSSSFTYLPTTVTLDRIPSSIYAGQSITFTGKLTSSGAPISNAIVKIMEDDPLVPDQRLVIGRTDSNGKFSIPWKVVAGYVEQDFDIYSTFDGDSKYSYARSYNQEMSILRYGGSITLDKIPTSAEIGDSIQFSGTLQLSQRSSEGAVVYIKDEDPFSADDLLATAYVDGSGRFSANWFVNYVDTDDVADIYAVFEGNDILARLTTCDVGSTMPIGGSCMNTIPLRIFPPPPPPIGTLPTPDPTLTGKEYMNLFYSLNLNQNPKVAIVPSPDSYDKVRPYIGSVQEGIKMWESALEQKLGGTWKVDFEVVQPGSLYFQTKPDIIVNLVTPDQDTRCLWEYSGWAKIWRDAKKPVQTTVCTSSLGGARSHSDVAATAAHEFIHAMGLGHAFNKKGDFMCSVENGVQTCPNSITRSNQPSDFNLEATGYLYNSDGFKNPNRKVSYESKFTSSNYSGESLPSPITEPVIPSNPTSKSTIEDIRKLLEDSDGDGIPDSRDKCKSVKENYNGYQDTDGCPDIKPVSPITKSTIEDIRKLLEDSDGDGIIDSRDKCKFVKENYNGYQDTDGCPDIKPVTRTFPEKKIPAQFVDPSKDPKLYVQRYVAEESYRTWFEKNYPDYTFHEALGITKDQFDNLSKEIKNSNSEPQEKIEVVEEKQEKDFFTQFWDMLRSWFS